MNLDSTQKEIVTSSAQNIIVSAGAGSGKTRVLTERVKHLLSSGVSPENVVCITFTNKAADEMKKRLSEVEGIGDAFIGTIHSFANRILKASGEKYDILTLDKELEVLKYLIQKYAKYTSIDDYMKYVDLRKDIKLGIKDEREMDSVFKPSTLHEISIFYGKCGKAGYPENLYTVCQQKKIITFDQLLQKCTAYFSNIGGRLEYLLVDELQDIGTNEYAFLRSLNAEYNFYVGDDWQSIYEFKGGDVRIFLKLMNSHDWTTYYLSNNYRNAKNIIDLSRTIIHQADNILQKEVVNVREDSGTVEVRSKDLIGEYLNKIKNSGDYKDWFILVRTNKDVHEISTRLLCSGIPFVSFKQGGSNDEDIQCKMALDAVKVLTVHSSKGLESKNVILYGNFPIRQKSYLRSSDERKVMYVGVTRAKDHLIILN